MTIGSGGTVSIIIPISVPLEESEAEWEPCSGFNSVNVQRTVCEERICGRVFRIGTLTILAAAKMWRGKTWSTYSERSWTSQTPISTWTLPKDEERSGRR